VDYELAVYFGRFQPFHLGHQYIVDKALTIADQVLILIGSPFEPRSLRNPWLYQEREAMIRNCYTPEENKRIICKPVRDIRYNDTLWISQIQKAVYGHHNTDEGVTLVGRQKMGTGYYTSLFPQWNNIPIAHDFDMTGTEIRDHLFSGKPLSALKDQIPESLFAALPGFMSSADGKSLIAEYEFIRQYKKGWENAPFEPTHVTVDAVVIQSGHVLLIERGAMPGKGLWALPGGFISGNETLLEATIRKLREETKIKVPAPVLKGSIKGSSVFDDPFRSVRGRTITHAFHIELREESELPKIKGGGETSRCFWLPVGQLDSSKMFEDHYFIIQKMLGGVYAY